MKGAVMEKYDGQHDNTPPHRVTVRMETQDDSRDVEARILEAMSGLTSPTMDLVLIRRSDGLPTTIRADLVQGIGVDHLDAGSMYILRLISDAQATELNEVTVLIPKTGGKALVTIAH